MNNKPKFSIRGTAHKAIVAIRVKLNLKPQYTLPEIAQKGGMPVEYLENVPANYEGFMDWNDEPRFIAVNRDLPAHDRALFIARQLALRAQQRRFNSLVLDRPWKWEMFDAAPAKLKSKISQLDIEYRAHWLMLFWSTGDEFRAFIRAKPTRIWSQTFNDSIVSYHLSMLRAKLWIGKFCHKIATVAFPAS
jgi:hypothetical protein